MSNRYGSAEVSLPSDTEILITRVFDAPADLVFEVWTTPEHVRRWWCEAPWVITVCDIDLRPGGNWRYLMHNEDGFEVGFHGTFHEVEAPRRLVNTEIFEGVPGEDGALVTTRFAETDGVTTVTLLSLHGDKAERDMVIESGMEGGMQLCYDRVEDMVTAMAAARTA